MEASSRHVQTLISLGPHPRCTFARTCLFEFRCRPLNHFARAEQPYDPGSTVESDEHNGEPAVPWLTKVGDGLHPFRKRSQNVSQSLPIENHQSSHIPLPVRSWSTNIRTSATGLAVPLHTPLKTRLTPDAVLANDLEPFHILRANVGIPPTLILLPTRLLALWNTCRGGRGRKRRGGYEKDVLFGDPFA